MAAATGHPELARCLRRSSRVRRGVLLKGRGKAWARGAWNNRPREDAAFPESECHRRAGCTTAPPPGSGTTARSRGEPVVFVAGGKELFQRGKMRPTANASIAARLRRARAATHVRCRTVHIVSAIRLPPGRMSTIAAYDPSSCIERTRRTLQLLPLAVTASPSVCMLRRPPCQIECPSSRSSLVREMSPRTALLP
jgi:hypothetical protein